MMDLLIKDSTFDINVCLWNPRERMGCFNKVRIYERSSDLWFNGYPKDTIPKHLQNLWMFLQTWMFPSAVTPFLYCTLTQRVSSLTSETCKRISYALDISLQCNSNNPINCNTTFLCCAVHSINLLSGNTNTVLSEKRDFVIASFNDLGNIPEELLTTIKTTTSSPLFRLFFPSSLLPNSSFICHLFLSLSQQSLTDVAFHGFNRKFSSTMNNMRRRKEEGKKEKKEVKSSVECFTWWFW